MQLSFSVRYQYSLILQIFLPLRSFRYLPSDSILEQDLVEKGENLRRGAYSNVDAKEKDLFDRGAMWA